MQLRIIPFLTLLAFTCYNIPAKADAVMEIQQSETLEQDFSSIIAMQDGNTSSENDLETPQGHPVSESNKNENTSKRRQMWINIGLAATAVVVAVVALIVVSNNNGHHHK